MKKKRWIFHCRRITCTKQIFRVMKLTTFLLFVMFFQVSAGVFSQNNGLLNLKAENESVSNILKLIEENSEFRFLFNSNNIDVERKTDINCNSKSIEEVLNMLFEGTGVKYRSFNSNYVLFTEEEGFFSSAQQQKSISGKVTDSSGGALPGVTILVKGTTSGIITDTNGNYTLTNVPSAATLVFSFVGMKTQEILVGVKTNINVSLAEETVGLEEVVAVGYGTQRKGNLTGSIASVKSEKLTIAPITNISNALVGQMPGLVSKQSSGLPGSDLATLNIRGFGSALVIVDGIESSFNNIDVNQIESVSILKDGAASIYGARAGNGVILVTTKRGQDQKPTITLNSSYTLQGVVKMLKPSSSGQRSEMERETYLQSGRPEANAPWTAEAVAKFFAGDDPAYPNTNWFDYVFRPWAPQQNHNLSIRGGSDKIKYYGFFGYLDQETMIKRNGGDYSRYNVQSNIDAAVTKDLNITIDISTAFENRNFPIRGLQNGGYVWQDAYLTRPWYPTELPDATKIPMGRSRCREV